MAQVFIILICPILVKLYLEKPGKPWLSSFLF